MATAAECEAAMHRLAALLSSAGATTRAAVLDRSVSCMVTDLDVVFLGRLRDGGLHDITRASTGETGDSAKIRLRASSDDLIELSDGRLPMAKAWGSGRLKFSASPMDLLRLRALF